MRAQGLEVNLVAPAPAMMKGNRQLLAQMITNLLENALKYVPAGGRVDVRVANTAGGISF
jgi:signal transduction histidine kinase